MQAEQNIVYSEVFPQHPAPPRQVARRRTIGRVGIGRQKRGSAAFGTTVKLIPDISRRTTQRTPERQWDILNFALAARDRGIGVGWVWVAPKVAILPSWLLKSLRRRDDKGCVWWPTVAKRARSVSVTPLDSILAERIGHGVQSLEGPILMAHLRL